MPITEILRHQLGMIQSERKIVLRNGQIIQGNIAKLFSNNLAEIQIGTHRLIAELTTSLRVGDSYYFQVRDNEQHIQLKVLTNHTKDNREDVDQITRLLGFKPTKSIANLIQLLITENIPFDRNQLVNASEIIALKGFKQQSLSLLQNMIRNRLPITENVFRALDTVSTESLTKVMTTLLEELTNSPSKNEQEQNISSLLRSLLVKLEEAQIEPNRSIIQSEGMKHLRTLLNVPIDELSQLMNQTKKENDATTVNIQSLIQNERVIKEQAQNLLTQFPHLKEARLTTEKLTTLTREIVKSLMPLLPRLVQETMIRLVREPTYSNQINLSNLLTSLGEEKTYEAAKLITGSGNSMPPTSIQNQFLSFIQQFITTMGLQDERSLQQFIQDLEEPQHLQSIKSYLLQQLSENNVQATEKYQPLLHFINGMQLQSIQDTNHLLIATLQLPGEKFSLNDDLFMKFEGKKSEDGTLDPDFCRILFVLNLKHLRETVIDMNIQKRVVAITIFNDFYKNSHDSNTNLKKILAKNLEQLRYQLSTITWKALHEQKSNENINIKNNYYHKEGFDFRV